MIHVYTKTRHIKKIRKFLTSISLEHKIFTINDDTSNEICDLGVSYAYPRKIDEPLLSQPKKGFVNYHPGPLPKYKGPNQYQDAIENKEIHWGVTVHFMDEEYDTGDIIKVGFFDYHEPITDINEANAIAHWHMFNLFKNTIKDIYDEKLTGVPQKEFPQIWHEK
jgi:methionyl-tRNA formyltransferase